MPVIMNTTRSKGNIFEMLPEGANLNNPARQCGVETGRIDNGVRHARYPFVACLPHAFFSRELPYPRLRFTVVPLIWGY